MFVPKHARKSWNENFTDKWAGFISSCICVHSLTIVTNTSENPFHEKIEPQDNYRVLSCAYWRKVLQKNWKFLCIKVEQKYLNHNAMVFLHNHKHKHKMINRWIK